MPNAIKSPIRTGDTIPHTAGRATITVQAVRPGVYAVTTYQGSVLRLAEWCHSYPTETLARAAARHTALAFRAHHTVQAIDARRQALTFEVRDQLNRRGSMRNRAILAAATAELDTLATLADLALLDDARHHLAGALSAL